MNISQEDLFEKRRGMVIARMITMNKAHILDMAVIGDLLVNS